MYIQSWYSAYIYISIVDEVTIYMYSDYIYIYIVPSHTETSLFTRIERSKNKAWLPISKYGVFAEYGLFYRALLQKRHIISRNLLIVATPYGEATISRLLKLIGLFCKRALLKIRNPAKETYNLKEPTAIIERLHSQVSRLQVWGGYD